MSYKKLNMSITNKWNSLQYKLKNKSLLNKNFMKNTQLKNSNGK